MEIENTPKIEVLGMLENSGTTQQHNNRVHSVDGISPTLTAVSGGTHHIKIFDISRFRVRKLTPTEYGRLQAFPVDSGWEQVVSDSQAYKQFGNAVTVSVVTAIADRLRECLEIKAIEIFEKERYYDDSPFTGGNYMYPTYMRKDGKEYFMFNRREPDVSWQLQANEERKAFLIANGGRYFKFNGFYDDPFEMLRVMAERKHTFTEPEENNYCGSIEKTGFLDFHGNRREVSAAFHYRIYDPEMAEKIKEAVHHIHQKEWSMI